MKKIVLSLFLVLSLSSFAQNVNDYQYVIVPIKFDFLKENDRFRLNTTTKFLLQKYGFKSFLSTDQAPEEASNNRCAVLYAVLENDNSFFITKVKLVLKDCQEKTVFETNYGISRIKDYAPAYNEALRAAFKSFDSLNYKYNGKSTTPPTVSVPAVTTISETTNNDLKPITPATGNSVAFYFAQPTANGYQVIDNEPKVIMRLYNTSQKNVFMAEKNGVNGTVLIKEDKWVFEHYDNGKLVSEPINLKF